MLHTKEWTSDSPVFAAKLLLYCYCVCLNTRKRVQKNKEKQESGTKVSVLEPKWRISGRDNSLTLLFLWTAKYFSIIPWSVLFLSCGLLLVFSGLKCLILVTQPPKFIFYWINIWISFLLVLLLPQSLVWFLGFGGNHSLLFFVQYCRHHIETRQIQYIQSFFAKYRT